MSKFEIGDNQIFSEARWYVLRTRPKSEHIAANALAQRSGIEVYCPRLKFRKMTSRGKVTFTEALFPGYIFAHFSVQQHLRTVSYSNAVLNVLKFGNQCASVSDVVISQLRENMGGADLKNIEITPELGEEAEICLGPFKGMRGTVSDLCHADKRVWVLLDFLGRVNNVQVPIADVKAKQNPVIALNVH